MHRPRIIGTIPAKRMPTLPAGDVSQVVPAPIGWDHAQSPEGVMRRLGELGALDATHPRHFTVAHPPRPIAAPQFLIDGPACESLIDGGDLFLRRRETRGRHFLRHAGGRLPNERERPFVKWLAGAVHAIRKQSVVGQKASVLDRVCFLPSRAPALQCMDGLTDFGLGLLLIDTTPSFEGLAVIAHEMLHWSSVQHMWCGNATTRVSGCGFQIASQFAGLDEGYTTKLANRAITCARRHPKFCAAIRRYPRPDRRFVADWRRLHHYGYLAERRILNEVMLAMYGTYTGRATQGKKFSALADAAAATILAYFDQGYFAGNPTIFGMLYHTLGPRGFAELAGLGIGTP